ncbi:MAG: hypothetical protein PHR61_00905 [Candidatus Absconditabacteria bacterium]|nr:hypothetical protein [Candidatus Absconditabacteria bacterium]
MNNKPFLLAGSIALCVIALTLVFMAGRISGNDGILQGFNRFDGRGQMMGGSFEGRGGMYDRDGSRGQMMNRKMEFINESALSVEQKAQLDQIQESQQAKMQELMQSFRTGGGVSETEIESLWKVHMTEIRPFVAQDQLDEFDVFVEEGKPQMPRMIGRNWR